jgi:hypothetical protein
MTTLAEMEAKAELSFKVIDALIEGSDAMIQCFEMLSPLAYLEIVESVSAKGLQK